MAGGSWTTQNKIRPGAYINVRSNSQPVGINSVRGIVTLPWSSGWGGRGIVEVTQATDTLLVLGYEMNAPEMLYIREALRGATTVVLYRVNEAGGEFARATSTGFTVQARHRGIRGNDITVRVVADVETDYYIVNTLIDTATVDTQRVQKVADLAANDFVAFSGTSLTVTAGLRLAGGLNGAVVLGAYRDYFDALESYDFNAMALPTDDADIKELAKNNIQRMRDFEGKKCQLVVSDLDADHEGIINVDQPEITAWVAGVTAGANVNESNTHRLYNGEIDVKLRHVNSDIEGALRSGKFVFRRRGLEDIIVEQDINSLVSFTAERDQSFSKNRVIRVLDDIVRNVSRMFSANFIGRVTNNEDGRNLFRATVIEYLQSLENIGAIENFDLEDVQIAPGNTKDSVVATVGVMPTDAMEKLYMDIESR